MVKRERYRTSTDFIPSPLLPGAVEVGDIFHDAYLSTSAGCE